MASPSIKVRDLIALRFSNVVASAAAVILACGAFAFAPYHQEEVNRFYGPDSIGFTGLQFLTSAAGVYILLLSVHFLSEHDPHVSKSLRFFQVVLRFMQGPILTARHGLSSEDRLAVLSTLLKAFFGPMMALWLMAHCMSAWYNGLTMQVIGVSDLGIHAWFNRVGFWFLMQVILFVDVLLFTVGYLVESRRLGNQIRSVDPTLLGWAAALMCYPPFNAVTSKVLGAPVSDFPQFDDPTLHLGLNVLLLGLMAIYASASVALGLKASNLTHRGVVAHGPYSIIRHPAYTCKNMAWWIGSMPMVFAGFNQSIMAGFMTLGSVAGWTMLYVLRAVTEEDHLRKVDGEYDAYAAKVRYRFVPGLV